MIKFCQWLATGRWFSPGTPVSNNEQAKKDKSTNNYLQNTSQKTKDRATWTPLKTRDQLKCSGRVFPLQVLQASIIIIIALFSVRIVEYLTLKFLFMSTTGGKQFIACNHLRSYDYFTESITTTCPFIAYHCTDYASFQVNLYTQYKRHLGPSELSCWNFD